MASITHVNRAATRFQLGSLCNRITTLARDCLMAIFFGANPAVGAFVIVYRILSIPGILALEGALRAGVVPFYEKIHAKSRDDGIRFIRDLSGSSIVGTLTLILAMQFVLVLLLTTINFSPSTREVLLLAIMLAPIILTTVQVGILGAFLNSEHRFFIPSFGFAVGNAIWALGIVSIWLWKAKHPIMAMSGILVIGNIVAFLIVLGVALPIAWRVLGPEVIRGIRLLPRAVRHAMLPLGYALVSFSAPQVNVAINPIFARFISPSGPAYLYYANRIEIFVLALIGFGLVGGLLPSLTRVIQAQNRHRYEVLLSHALRRSIELMMPATIGILLFGLPLVNLLFGRGNFTPNDVVLTSQCLWASAIANIPRVIVLIQISVFYAHAKYKEPGWVGVITIAINVVLNLVFTLPLQLAPWWIVLFTALSAIAQMIIFFFLMNHTGNHVSVKPLWIALLKSFVVSAILGIMAVLIFWPIFDELLFTAWFGVFPDFLRPFWQQLLHFACPAGLYILALYFTRKWYMVLHLE